MKQAQVRQGTTLPASRLQYGINLAYGGKAGEIEEVQLIGSGARTFCILNKKPSVYFKTQKQREEEDIQAAGELREWEGGPLSDGASFDDGPFSELNVPGDGAGSQSLHSSEVSAFLASTAALCDMAMEYPSALPRLLLSRGRLPPSPQSYSPVAHRICSQIYTSTRKPRITALGPPVRIPTSRKTKDPRLYKLAMPM